MADIRVTGTPMEIELIARAHGTVPRMSRRRDGKTAGYFEIEAPRVICLDCETTGLSPIEDEILTLSIVDWSGRTLYDGKFKPCRKTEWTEAARVNGIWPEDVADCPSLFDETEYEKIREIVWSADELIAYNVKFDLGFLSHNDVEPQSWTKITDTMLEFAREYGDWDDYHNGWRWHKLVDAAEFIGYKWTGRAHGSLADALACLAVQKWVENRRRESE